MDKQIIQLRWEYLFKQEKQFLDAMQLDLELEEQQKAFGEEKLVVKIVRKIILKVEELP